MDENYFITEKSIDLSNKVIVSRKSDLKVGRWTDR